MSKATKVVLVAPYFAPRGGGLERYVETIAAGLAGSGDWEVAVITSGLGTKLKQRQHDKIRVYELPLWFKFGNTPLGIGWSATIRRLLKQERPALVNVHLPVPGLGDLAAREARKLHIPVVVTYHAGHLRKGRLSFDFLGFVYENLLLKRLLDKASGVVATSQYVRQEFMQRQAHKTTVIHPSFDQEIFRPANRLARNTIVFNAGLGRAEVTKGLKRVLAALAILARRGLRPSLLVIGDGDERTNYEQLAEKLGVASQVTFLGRLESAAVAEAYRRSTVLALPTSNDNFPTVIVEAMACGLPVISTPVGGIPELVDPEVNGFLVPPRAAADLADRLAELLGDHALATQLGRAGRARALSHLTNTHQVEQTATWFRHTIKAASRPLIAQIAAYYPPHLGGLERVTAVISERLASDGYRVEMLASDRGRAAEPRVVYSDNLRIRRLRSFEMAHTPIMPTLAWRLWRLPKPVVMHLHLAQAGLPETVWLVAKLRRLPYIVHFHLDVEPSGRLGRLFLVYKRTIQGLVLRDAAKVIVLSDEQARVVRSQWAVIRDRVEVLENGVTVPGIKPRDFTATGPLRLLYVGRLAKQKRVDRLLQAISQVDKAVQLTIVGDGEDARALRALSMRLGLTNVVFAGSVAASELAPYYEAAEVFVLPSDQEGMPLAAMEAMAYGLPVVGTNVLGIRELVGGAGVLVSPTPGALAAGITELARDRSRLVSLSRASLERARTKDWAHTIARLEQLYGEVSS